MEPNKQQLIKAIDHLTENPKDRVKILGDIGISATGVLGGAAAASSIAGIVGATSIPLLSSGAGLFGFTLVAATPIGWIIGAALAGGAATYGISRLISSGSKVEQQKQHYLGSLRAKLGTQKHIENTSALELEKTDIIKIIKILVLENALKANIAFKIIEALETKKIEVEELHENLLEMLVSIGMFSIVAPLALKIAEADGVVEQQELDCITKFFVVDKGYPEIYVKRGLSNISQSISNIDLNEVSISVRDFVHLRNDFTNDDIKRVLKLLEEIVNADGIVHDEELKALGLVKHILGQSL
jgi:uncharacterized tellurite resistance protein B-like protein